MQEVVYFAVNIILLEEYVALISHKMSLLAPEFLHFLKSEETWLEDTKQTIF